MRFLIVSLALLFSSFSFSADYYWRSSHGETGFSTPLQACSIIPNGTNSYNWKDYKAVRFSDSKFFCTATKFNAAGYILINAEQPNGYGEAYRSGDSCPTGSIYNSTTGACNLPVQPPGTLCPDHPSDGRPEGSNPFVYKSDGECSRVMGADKPAQCKYLAMYRPSQTVKFKVADWEKDAGASTDPEASKIDLKIGCQVQTLKGSKCVYSPSYVTDQKLPDGSFYVVPGSNTCTVDAVITGAVSVNGPDSPSGTECLVNPSVCELPEPQNNKEEKPCTPVVDAEGRKSCSVFESQKHDDSDNCGTGPDGAFKCTPAVPKSNGVHIATEEELKALADGKTQKTTTKKQTETTCGQYPSSCVTKVTETKNVSITNSGGAVDSNSGSCKGASCPSDTNPDVNGDGFGDCKGPDCGKEEKGGSAGTSGDCGVPPPCDGDPFQCAILKQSWQNTCKELEPPTTEQQNIMDQKVADSENKIVELQQELDQKVSTLISDFKAGSTVGSVGSGVCLPDYPIQFLDRQIILPFSQVCPYIAMLAKALLVIAYMVSARIVSREF